ncbi:MAG: hypothetical protein L3J11_11635, partial [Draconibacterium sp.]|nr:hypothetical protein [Draconibacterium sp.]
ILDEIFIFRYLVMPEHQLIEKNENITKRYFFDFMCFWTGLIITIKIVWQNFSFPDSLRYFYFP